MSQESRKRRLAGDPRLSEDGRQLLDRITIGDLVDAFQDVLDAQLETDALLSGHDDADS